MVEITGHEPIEDAAVLLETPVAERFKIDGFRGLRRAELKAFARPFFISEDNPNGTIEPFKDDLPKEKIIPMLNMYLSQGKFGDDPFNLRPQDKMADLQRQIEELKAMHAGPKANPETTGYKPPAQVPRIDPLGDGLVGEVIEESPPPAEITEAMVDAPSVSLAFEDMDWDQLRTYAKHCGIKPWKKTRTVLISEIEAKEAE